MAPKRTRTARLATLVLASFAVFTWAPAGALAGSGNHGRRHDGHGAHRGHQHYDHHARRGNSHRDQRRYRYDRRVHVQSHYYCAACNHGFNRRSDFYAHVSGTHFVAPWLLPFVIIQHALGWIFYG